MANRVGQIQLCAETMPFSQNIPNGTISRVLLQHSTVYRRATLERWVPKCSDVVTLAKVLQIGWVNDVLWLSLIMDHIQQVRQGSTSCQSSTMHVNWEELTFTRGRGLPSAISDHYPHFVGTTILSSATWCTVMLSVKSSFSEYRIQVVAMAERCFSVMTIKQWPPASYALSRGYLAGERSKTSIIKVIMEK